MNTWTFTKTKKMRTTKFLIAIVAIGLAACNTTKKISDSAYEPATPVEATVVGTTTPANTPVVAPVEEKISDAKITETKDKYQMENGTFVEKPYHIIVGSFQKEINARNLKNDLVKKGMESFIAVNQNGMFRVFAFSSDDERQIRIELVKVREKFPDAWILKLAK